MSYYKDKVIVITGGAKGIGNETAKLISSLDAIIYVLDIDNNLIERLNKFNCNINYLNCDVGDYEDVEKIIRTIINKHNNIDILINNAGIQVESKFSNYDYDKWQKVMKTNFFGTCNCIHNISKYMKSGSTILNIISIHSKVPRLNKYCYDSSKSAIEMLTKELAIELAPEGITINALSFGAVDTDMNSSWKNKLEERKLAFERVPLKIIFNPQQIACFIKVIIESFSNYTTGSIFIIDGGRSLI